jgi:hypothetical protein
MIHSIPTKTDSDHKGLGKIRNYNEVIAYLDSLPQIEYSLKSASITQQIFRKRNEQILYFD